MAILYLQEVSSFGNIPGRFFALARIDDDPFLDLVVQGANEVVVALADGEGGFARSQSLTPAATGELTVSGSPVGVLATMLDGDMLTDLAIVVPDTDEVLVYLGQASGTFGSPTRYASGGDAPLQLVAGDFVGNIAPDLAIAHVDGSLTILRGDATGALALQAGSTVTGLGSVTGLATADVGTFGASSPPLETALILALTPVNSRSPCTRFDLAVGHSQSSGRRNQIEKCSSGRALHAALRGRDRRG